jgi:hypothetical protein
MITRLSIFLHFYVLLNEFFHKEFNSLNCREDTKAYVVGIFDQLQKPSFDFSKESLTILYSEAKTKQSFVIFQQLADWLFICNTLYPEHLHNASIEYYYTLARLSYYSCYRMMNKTWITFEELSDNFIPISTQAHIIIKQL